MLTFMGYGRHSTGNKGQVTSLDTKDKAKYGDMSWFPRVSRVKA